MKVLVVTGSFPPMKNGGADYALRLCQELAQAGLEIAVITSRIENVATDARFPVHAVMRRWSWREMPRLLQIARRFRPDVIDLHFQGQVYDDHPMITLLPTFCKRLLPGARVVTHIEWPMGVRSYLKSRATRLAHKVAERWVGREAVDREYGTILRDSDRIIVLSDTHRATLAERLAVVNEKSELVPPPPILPMAPEAGGASRRRGREMLGVAPDAPLLAYFGYIYPSKGIETLLEALPHVAREQPGVRLVLIGGTVESSLKRANRPNYLQELRDLARRLDIEDRVIWTGYYPVDSDHASLYLRAADVCVLPFNDGVFLNNSSFAAAVAHGLPVVTTRGDALEPAFVDGENVLLCPPRDARALATAIHSLLACPDLRRRVGSGALVMAQRWFSWDRAVRRTVAVFEGK